MKRITGVTLLSIVNPLAPVATSVRPPCWTMIIGIVIIQFSAGRYLMLMKKFRNIVRVILLLVGVLKVFLVHRPQPLIFKLSKKIEKTHQSY